MTDEPLNEEQARTLWLLGANPDTWALDESLAPDWLIAQCAQLGLITPSGEGRWKLTEAGYKAGRAKVV